MSAPHKIPFFFATIFFIGTLASTVRFDVDYEESVTHVAKQYPEPVGGKTTESGVFSKGIFEDEHDLAEERLEVFSGRLKAFISETMFDVVGFENSQEVLATEFQSLQSWISKMKPTLKLDAQVRVVSRLFETMAKTLRSLKEYSNVNAPGIRLLYKMTELHVLCLALYNSFGNLDHQIAKVDEKVLFLRDRLYEWHNKFEQMPDVPFEIVSDFRVSFNQAESCLFFLTSFVDMSKLNYS